MKNRKSVISYVTSRTYEALKDADVAELADALGSGPSSPKECGFKSHRRYQFRLEMFCGYGITAVHQPSKLVMGVRLPLPAPNAVVEFPSGQRGQTVNLLSPTSMVRIHLPPPFLISERQQSLPFFTIYASDSRNMGCLVAGL